MQRIQKWKWIGLISLLPICALILFSSYVFYGEAIASSSLTRQFDELRQAGLPYDNDSLAVYFEKQTHNEGTAAWSEVLELCKAIEQTTDSTELPIVGSGQISYKLMPGSEWPDEPRVAEFLQEVQPMIKRINASDSVPKPVRMPIEFHGYNTTLEALQIARRTSLVLQLDSVFALYKKEHDRALKDITAIRAVKEAFDWRFCLASSEIESWIASNHCKSINRSLRMNLWNDDQLAILAAQVKEPFPVLEKWKEVLTCERTLAFDPQSTVPTMGAFVMNVRAIPAMPSARLQVFQAFDNLMSCADQGIERFRQNVELQNGPPNSNYQGFVFLNPQERSGRYSLNAAFLVKAERPTPYDLHSHFRQTISSQKQPMAEITN